ncbi:hypothetical protein OEA41_007934 [Lepraria neglecta]|uniref:Nephrocystin 3-like N-terminal domain-containing protein n=1 Tax=Lepraria neglecta TaxID=209136 RepID=A0AAD9ZDL9_9LECA|nr:hypothetical protein OEA41_007934 [Lepraria neglecta]
MGDPLSTAGSIIAVIQISGKVLSVCYHYAASLKQAPREIQWVINEVGSLKVILEELRALALLVADNERPAVSGKSSLDLSIARSSGRLKRRREKNAEEHQHGRVSRKKGNMKSSVSSESSQDNHTSLNASNAEPSSLAGHLAASHIENNPPGSDHSALFKSLDAAHGPLKTCESALKAISDKIGTLVGARRPASTLTWPLKEKAVQKILEVIQKQKSNLILALAADGARAIEKIENSLDENAELVSQLFEAIAQNTETTSMIRDSIQEANERQQREKILSWLQSTDHSANHAAAWEEHEDKTGDWLLQCESYRQWLESKGQLTWLNGISGCGKTVLTATVLEDVKKYCSTYPDWQYTYYYFDFHDAAKRKPVSMVQSIIAQLARSMKPLPEDLTNLYENNASGQHQPSVKSLMPVLASAIQSRPVVYLVLDALDECLEWEELLRAIEALNSSCDNLNIFMSSRREYGLTATLSRIATHDVKIQSAAVDADINLFVQTCLSSDSVLREWPTTVKAEIKEALVSRCDGM